MTVTNVERTQAGKVRAVCEYCGRRSRPVDLGDRTRLGVLDLPAGWSEAPYSPDYRHRDGSTGSLFTCPECARRRAAGERLAPTPERAAARQAEDLGSGLVCLVCGRPVDELDDSGHRPDPSALRVTVCPECAA